MMGCVRVLGGGVVRFGTVQCCGAARCGGVRCCGAVGYSAMVRCVAVV